MSAEHDAQPRAATGLLIAALVRHVNAAGGHAAVLARGDPTAGAILLGLRDRASAGPLLERRLGPAGYLWDEAGPADPAEADAYVARRRRTDPDLWVVEVDHPDARALATALLG